MAEIKIGGSISNKTETATTAAFDFCLTSIFFHIFLQVKPGPHRTSREPLGLAGVRSFAGKMFFLSPNQQCQSTEGTVQDHDNSEEIYIQNVSYDEGVPEFLCLRSKHVSNSN